jgi:hypothetical protein
MIWKTVEQTMKDKYIAIRLCPPRKEGDNFDVSAVLSSGIVTAAGYGVTLEKAVAMLLEELGIVIEAEKEEACMILT